MTHTNIAKSTYVFPTGATVDDYEQVRPWILTVEWRGPRGESGRGGYAVTNGSEYLSRADKWAFMPEPFKQKQYRWETFDEALDHAEAVIDHHEVMGRTWAAWRTSLTSRV